MKMKKTLSELCGIYYRQIRQRCLAGLFYQESTAEEVTQDVFLEFCRQYPKIKEEAVGAWLCRTADHKILQYRARCVRDQAIMECADLSEYEIGEMPDLDEILISRKIEENLELYFEEIASRLAEKERRLAQYLRQEKGYAEIAELTGNTVGGVTMAVRRLFEKVRTLIRELLDMSE